ncbi:DUF11 domain-containing protein [Amorphoplanes digitatis]|uniref:Gram-positive cocci surface proteins LPxTG domain-containing protein n=1 Tax=Actinoplanes digitatis TaxID=1868 RepID=A0A7W7I0L2_9ACTN|nr:DUF11 domain-containing protein [Actinoplanes digitatis]MBB4764261.1 hypothetical protein [Actinoplanes digitatis]
MAAWIRRGAAVVGVAVLGALLLTGPAVAAPPAAGDETLKLYSDDPSASRPPGGTISYEMTATRHPTAAAQHRTVVLELPEGVTFRSADYPQAAGPCVADAAKRTVTCTTKARETSARWRVDTDVAKDAPQGVYVTAKATLTTEQPDPEPANNVSTTDVFITAGGELSVAVSAPKGPWQVGAKFDAEISVHNAGPYRTPLRVNVFLLPVKGLRPTALPAGCEPDTGILFCDIEMIEAGATLVLPVSFEVTRYDKDGLSVKPVLIPVGPDADRTNNEATYAAEIVAPPASPSPTPTQTAGGGGAGEPSLPITGSPVAPLALTGLVLLVAGAGAVLLARRRA